MEQLLIVEDDIGLNQGLCKALKVDDRKIISCQDLKTAKEQLLCGGVSLILLDINLPDGSGLELLREVKENTPGIPVILLTANDTDLDIVEKLAKISRCSAGLLRHPTRCTGSGRCYCSLQKMKRIRAKTRKAAPLILIKDVYRLLGSPF